VVEYEATSGEQVFKAKVNSRSAVELLWKVRLPFLGSQSWHSLGLMCTSVLERHRPLLGWQSEINI
jgi:hypothetical protein